MFVSDLEVFRLCSYHGRHHPTDVDGVVSLQVVHFSVLLVLRADLEQIHARLQDSRFVLNGQKERNVRLKSNF